MFAFVVNFALLLFVFTQHNPFIVSPALLPKGNLTKILDILNGKFGVTNKKNTTAVDGAQSSLTEKERKLMDTLMNRLYIRVIDDGLGAERTVESRAHGGVNGFGEDARVKRVTRVDGADDDENADAMMNFGLTRQAFTRDHTGPRSDAPAGFTATSGKRDDFDRRLSAAEDAVTAASGSPDPLLERFVRLADMLDRPDGVNEAVQTMLAIPSFLNRSAVLDERCPFDRLIDDDEQLVSSIVRRLRCLRGFKSNYSGLTAD